MQTNKPLNIALPEYACRASFRVEKRGLVDCDHRWTKDEHDDWDVSWIEWTCRRCGARATCEVLQ